MPDSLTNHEAMQASPKIDSFFRSEAWVQAWLDTYGNDPRIRLLDPLGRNNPLEIFYCIKSPVRKWLPLQTVALAGTAIHPLSAPRSEYNNAACLLSGELLSAVQAERWSQIVFKDMDYGVVADIKRLAEKGGWFLHYYPPENTYYISASDVGTYKASLNASIRARYFNRRQRLSNAGCLEFKNYELSQADQFFDVLDVFHNQRWGQPCYSPTTRLFLKNFMQRIASVGNTVMQVMMLDGKPMSALYDVIYKHRRYNVQSGFNEQALPGLSLGALHMGFAIENAITSAQEYDFLAGNGKHHNYKASITNRNAMIQTVIVEKPHLARLRGLKQIVSALYRG